MNNNWIGCHIARHWVHFDIWHILNRRPPNEWTTTKQTRQTMYVCMFACLGCVVLDSITLFKMCFTALPRYVIAFKMHLRIWKWDYLRLEIETYANWNWLNEQCWDDEFNWSWVGFRAINNSYATLPINILRCLILFHKINFHKQSKICSIVRSLFFFVGCDHIWFLKKTNIASHASSFAPFFSQTNPKENSSSHLHRCQW